jgi:hypothetical protein
MSHIKIGKIEPEIVYNMDIGMQELYGNIIIDVFLCTLFIYSLYKLLKYNTTY